MQFAVAKAKPDRPSTRVRTGFQYKKSESANSAAAPRDKNARNKRAAGVKYPYMYQFTYVSGFCTDFLKLYIICVSITENLSTTYTFATPGLGTRPGRKGLTTQKYVT